MKMTPINSDSAPAADGAYSQASLVEHSERLLFISGQIPESPDGRSPIRILRATLNTQGEDHGH